MLFYNVPNRGNGAVGADEDGHIRVISGWQGDIRPSDLVQSATVPVARGRNGKSITGPALARFVDVAAGPGSVPISGGIVRGTPRPTPVSLDTRQARLFHENGKGGASVVIASADWAYADCSSKPFPGKPDTHQLCVRSGFDAKSAYTLVYRGRDLQVLGIGFAATRDFVSFLRSGRLDDAGNTNPAAGTVRWTVASGTSQSGNFLKSFVNLGFNADESGNRVFDGINPDIAARHAAPSIRFGVPGGAAGTYEPGSEGTLWWGRYNDRVRGRGTSSLLDRCTASRTCPRIIETFGSAEFWGFRISPGLAGTDAMADIPLPPNVRRYYFPGVTHGGARGGTSGGFRVQGDAIPGGCLLRGNPNPSSQSLSTAQKALVSWVKDGTEPPPSRFPSIGNGDLVAPTSSAMGWPIIPGAPTPDGKINPFLDQHFGPHFRYHDLSGVLTRLPPLIRKTIPSLVPRVDQDGNEIAGVRSVYLQVPLGTYLGWNVQASGYAAAGGCGFSGGFLAFAKSKADRLASGDPRLSLEERCGDHAGFVAKDREALARQQTDGWLLPDDAAMIVRKAEASNVLK